MTYQDLEEEYNYELKNNRELMFELSELKNKYKEIKKWGYSMRDSAHKFDKELQELKNKSCDGCMHYVQINKSDSFVCSLLLDCSRKYKPKDRFEAKDKQ